MSKRTQKNDNGLSGQQGLFDTDMSEGAFDNLLGLKQLMSSEMRGEDRFMIAAQISRLSGYELSKAMLDKYVSSDPAYRPPADMLQAFCHLMGSHTVFEYLLEPLGIGLAGPEDMKYMRLARLQAEREKLDQEILSLRAQCKLK